MQQVKLDRGNSWWKALNLNHETKTFMRGLKADKNGPDSANWDIASTSVHEIWHNKLSLVNFFIFLTPFVAWSIISSNKLKSHSEKHFFGIFRFASELCLICPMSNMSNVESNASKVWPVGIRGDSLYWVKLKEEMMLFVFSLINKSNSIDMKEI